MIGMRLGERKRDSVCQSQQEQSGGVEREQEGEREREKERGREREGERERLVKDWRKEGNGSRGRGFVREFLTKKNSMISE